MGLSSVSYLEWVDDIISCVKDNAIFMIIFLLQEGFINYLTVAHNLTMQVMRYSILLTSLKKHEGILLACHGC